MFTTTCPECGASFFRWGAAKRGGLYRACCAATLAAETLVISDDDAVVAVHGASDPLGPVRHIYEAALEIPEPYSDLSPDAVQAAAALLDEFDALAAAHPDLPRVDMLRPILLSKNGRHDEARETSAGRYAEAPGWETAVAAANAARRSGDMEEAATLFADATAHDPDDLACLLEVGDIRLEQARWDEALTAYERVLARDDAHGWALPSAFYCRHQLGRPGNWIDSLHEVANQEGCTCGLEGCLTTMFGGYGSGQAIARAEYLLDKLADHEQAGPG
jgi:tetratricopeptide (TPR) repeat protein